MSIFFENKELVYIEVNGRASTHRIYRIELTKYNHTEVYIFKEGTVPIGVNRKTSTCMIHGSVQ